MNEEESEFDIYVDLYDTVKSFKLNRAEEILKNFESKKGCKFNLTGDETKRRNLSSTAVCTYALSEYINFWNVNKKSKYKRSFCTLDGYYDYICDKVTDSNIPETELLDEFGILNILHFLQKIRCGPNSKKFVKYDKKIMEIIRALCKQFIENEFNFKEQPHPFIYYRFLSMVEDTKKTILKDINENINEWRKGKETGKLNSFIDKIIYKYLFSVGTESKLAKEFETNGISVYANDVGNSEKGNDDWTITDKENNTYIIKKESGKLNIYKCGSSDDVFNFFYDRIYDNAKYDMYRQIAFYHANDRTLFDVKRLIYSLLIVTKNDRYSDNLIKDKVLELIFNEQFDATGLLPIGHVVNNDFVITEDNQIDVRRVSTNPILSSVECFNDLLTHKSLEMDLERYQDNFELTYEWIMKRLRKNPDNRSLGWYPEYESTHTPESWVGGHTLLFLKNYCKMLSKLIKKSACKYLQYKEYRELKTLDITWAKLYDSYEIKKYIDQCMGNKVSYYRSALIFGPPGSGKSTIPKALAKKLKWDYVELTPGLFLAKGNQNIISEANNIFKRLKRMKDTVIFFDEVDELVKSRKDYSANAWIVTALLPEFADLWKRKEIKFILATNDITKVDSAVMRGGRIDLVLPMGGICWKNRLKILKDAIDNDNNAVKEELKNRIFGKLRDENVDNIDRNNIEEQGTDELKNFLERTNFVPVIEIEEIIRELFKGANIEEIERADIKNIIKDIENRQQFKIFFKGIGGIGNFENGEFKKFHDDLLSKLYPNIKLPSTERAEETEYKKKIKDVIIRGNTF
ncbi:MAG: hypothetical protein AEth_00489 [Candidatus Argoarchaeum ethanivorans]|uniref:AAA+ ATPase domain-containing protein n=1 Tax=Candidatus Argoarchaeum ethanivorans TaxID=2608793 RepID=A0A8B3S462_9EURY|nr:MAG: hypothetical protein AEth_00489 [Candidatus Argoarchaeum ethanivorans]